MSAFDEFKNDMLVYRAKKLVERRKFDEAMAKLYEARERYNTYPPGPEKDLCHARTIILEGDIRFAEGSVDDAIEAYGFAELLLSQSNSNAEDLARCRYDLALMLSGLNFPVQAVDMYLEMVEAALRIDAGGSKDILSETIRIRAVIRAQLEGDTDSLLETRQRLYREAHGKSERAMRGYELAATMLGSLGDEAFQQAAELLKSSIEYFKRVSDLERYVQSLDLITGYRNVAWPKWANDASLHALNWAMSTKSLELQGQAHLARASYLFGLGQRESSLEHCLAALSIQIEHAYRSESITVRFMTLGTGERARELAIELASGLGLHEVVAELIESARLQVLPEGNSVRALAPHSSFAHQLLDASPRRLSKVHGISVDGRPSVLGRLLSPEIVGRTLELAEIIAAVGGSDSWWWGIWDYNSKIHWVLRDPASTCYSGILDVSIGTQLRSRFDTLEASTLAGESVSTKDVLNGVLCNSYQQEEDFFSAFGMEFIPGRLRAEISGNEISGEPISLVASGSLLARIPLALLGVECQSERRRCTRLVEACVIRLAPPAALIDKVRRHPVPAVPTYPVSVACVDPLGDLKYARVAPPSAERVFSGALKVDGGQGINVATSENVVRALRELGPAHPSLFYYSGHASGGISGGDLEAGLVLAGPSVLSADTLFGQGSNGEPVVPFPARTMLAACESSGARGTGSGEWLGITSAILWAGSRQVVSTNWRVWDTPLTQWIDGEIAQRLQYFDDAAEAVREVQLICLRMWRLDEIVPGESRRSRDSPGSYALPAIWTAYTAVGVR